MKKAFSLLELSIVLVIIGLIAGGIVAGSSMIRASELRAVVTEFTQYQTAVNTFRDKYLAHHGDMSNATSFWGAADGGDGVGTDCTRTASMGTETCDGNADGAVTNGTNERLRFWQHLANAELINGTYSGNDNSSDVSIGITGVTTPESKLQGGSFYTVNIGTRSGNANTYDGNYGNLMVFGAASGIGWTDDPMIKPEEAWNIDIKIDDGKPAIGNVRGWRLTSVQNPGCTTSDAEASAAYSLTSDAILCSVIFANAF